MIYGLPPATLPSVFTRWVSFYSLLFLLSRRGSSFGILSTTSTLTSWQHLCFSAKSLQHKKTRDRYPETNRNKSVGLLSLDESSDCGRVGAEHTVAVWARTDPSCCKAAVRWSNRGSLIRLASVSTLAHVRLWKWGLKGERTSKHKTDQIKKSLNVPEHVESAPLGLSCLRFSPVGLWCRYMLECVPVWPQLEGALTGHTAPGVSGAARLPGPTPAASREETPAGPEPGSPCPRLCHTAAPHLEQEYRIRPVTRPLTNYCTAIHRKGPDQKRLCVTFGQR